MPRRVSKHERPEYRLMFRVFDTETMEAIRTYAGSYNIPIAEAIRRLVELGIETERHGL